MDLSTIDNTVWAISAAGADTVSRTLAVDDTDIYAKYKDHFEKDALSLSEEGYSRRVESITEDGIATLNVVGVIFKYESFWSWLMGGTTTQGLMADLQALDADDRVKTVILRVDSPGGQASGLQELANTIRNMSTKTIAYVDGVAASAGYWIAAAADEIVVTESSEGGSIGVMAILRVQKDTNTITFVSKQSPKKDINPQKKEDAALIQDRVDELAELFISDVATFRGVGPETVENDFGRGWVLGGKEMVAVGMADRLGFLKDVIQTTEKQTMDLDELKAKHPELYQAALEQGVKAGTEQGMDAGRKAEAQRRADVQAQALPGHEDLLAEMLNDGKTTGPEAAQRILQAERVKREQRAETQREEAPKPAAATPEPKTEKKDVKIDDDDPKAQWDADESLRAEFGGDFECFKAFHEADTQGLVKYQRREAR